MAYWFEIDKNKTVSDCDDSIDRLSNIIKQTKQLDVVQDVNDWDWRSRFPDLETAVNVLLKQLEMQRGLLLCFYQSKYQDLIEKHKQLVNKTKEE